VRREREQCVAEVYSWDETTTGVRRHKIVVGGHNSQLIIQIRRAIKYTSPRTIGLYNMVWIGRECVR
jgi:hypothetical protein